MYLLSLTQFLNGFRHLFLRAASILHDTGGSRVDAKQSEQYRLYRYELIAILLCSLLCTYEYIITIIREIGLSALHAWQVFDLLIYQKLYLLGVNPEFLEDEVRYVLRLLHHTLENVCRFDDLLAVHLSRIDSCLNSLLCFNCKFV